MQVQLSLKDNPKKFDLEVEELCYDEVWEEFRDQLIPFIKIEGVKDFELTDLE